MLKWTRDRLRFRRAVRTAVEVAARTATARIQETRNRMGAATCREVAAVKERVRDIVLIPCWRRPEMLWHCIDNLCRADGIDELHVVFRPDNGYDPDNIQVINSFADRLDSFEIQLAPSCPYRRSKLSANVLLGYMHAAAATRRYVYLVEEDIMVARDFFRWHQGVHVQHTELFCSIAVHNHNREVVTPNDSEGYYLSQFDYCSWGGCFDHAVITDRFSAHIQPAYFSRPKHYLRRHFPASRVGLGYVEQASLIRRVQERSGRPIAYPAVPRAFHAGFYGRNRAGGMTGALAERVRRLQGVIYDRTAMRSLALSEAFAADSEPVNLDIDRAGCAKLKELAVPPPA